MRQSLPKESAGVESGKMSTVVTLVFVVERMADQAGMKIGDWRWGNCWRRQLGIAAKEECKASVRLRVDVEYVMYAEVSKAIRRREGRVERAV
jgi:hypothetical protein